jgi:Transposase DDE domain
VAPPDWTRTRCLTFEKVALLILQGHHLPLQNNLNQFYTAMGEVTAVPTASAYCQARQKLKPELFLYLNRLVASGFYQLYGDDDPGHTAVPLRKWQGHRVLAVDGTRWNVPDTPQNREQFAVQTNQFDPQGCVQAHGSVLYDVLNDIGLCAVLDKPQAEKEFIFVHYLEDTRVGDVIVLDRGYADYAVMAFCKRHRREFVIRMTRSSLSAVNAFWASTAREQIIEVAVSRGQQRFVREQGLPEVLRLRLVKVPLDNGEMEVLATSLLDTRQYKQEEFGQVYAWRWGVETYLDRLKNIFEIERFSGQGAQQIQQDFYGVLFLSSLESVLSKSAQAQLAQESHKRHCRYARQVNRSVSCSALLDHIMELLMDSDKSVAQTVEELHHLFQTNPLPRRPGRRFTRPRLTASQKLRYHRYAKRTLT